MMRMPKIDVYYRNTLLENAQLLGLTVLIICNIRVAGIGAFR